MHFRILSIFMFLFSMLAAQDTLEMILSQEEETYYPTELVEFLQNTKNNPVNINTIAENDLYLFPWLSGNDIKDIILYRKSHKISNLKDLSRIGIDPATVNELKEYIKFDSTTYLNLKQISRYEYNQSEIDLPNNFNYYQKTILTFNNFTLGFISQKDEGEKDPLDYYSYFVEYSTEKVLKKLVIGKYRLALGQGILFASKLGMSKSSAATSAPVKKFNPIKPYTSSYEIWELEGVSANIQISSINIIPFFSKTSLSANLDTLDCITSFNESGLHFDENKKNNVKETIFGFAAKYYLSDHSIGLNFAKINFDHKFNNSNQQNEYSAISTDLIINRNGFPAFSEVAYAQDKIAGVLGCKFGETELRHLILLRYYQKDFPTWHGNPFSSQSRFDNEIGLYYGITLIPLERTKLNCYFDVWSFPETRYFEKMATVGSEEFIQFEKKFNKNSLRISLQHKSKEKYISLDETKIRDFERTTFRADWWQKINNLRFKTRCELVTEYLSEDDIHKSGILVYEEVKWTMNKLTIIGQVSAYNSDVLHYMYEHNVDGIMQNSILKGDGFYSYFILKYDLLKNIELQCKLSDHWNRKDQMRMYLQFVSSF